jgi:hypothetical protein
MTALGLGADGWAATDFLRTAEPNSTTVSCSTVLAQLNAYEELVCVLMGDEGLQVAFDALRRGCAVAQPHQACDAACWCWATSCCSPDCNAEGRACDRCRGRQGSAPPMALCIEETIAAVRRRYGDSTADSMAAMAASLRELRAHLRAVCRSGYGQQVAQSKMRELVDCITRTGGLTAVAALFACGLGALGGSRISGGNPRVATFGCATAVLAMGALGSAAIQQCLRSTS